MANLFRSACLAVAAGVGVCAAGLVRAGELPANLGGGLETIHRVHRLNQVRGRAPTDAPAPPDPALREAAAGYLAGAIQDAAGRVGVRFHLNGDLELGLVRSALEKKGVEVTATLAGYRQGVIEGWLALDSTIAVAATAGVQSILLEQVPVTNVGAVTQQGVVQHRVDRIPQFDGTGISLGALSDSYGLTTLVPPAADVASGDLPGPGNPLGHTQPVVILQDSTATLGGGTDEGRAMLQVMHDLAPKARLAFATGHGGQIALARNIRTLASLPGFAAAPEIPQGFKADVIVDDILYPAEPMFSDGIVAQAVNDVTAAGVHYFSAAGNRPSSSGYAAELRLAPGDVASVAAASTINLTGVNPALYAGGFHNFRTDGTVDVAQTLRRTVGSGNSNRLMFQWDDPFDLFQPGTLIFRQSCTYAGTAQNFAVLLTAGRPSRVTASAAAGSTFDAIVTITDPSGGTAVAAVDTGTDETLCFTPTRTGIYSIQVTASGGTAGEYTVAAYSNSGPGVTTQLNVLFFRADTGAFISAFAQNNFAVNEAFQSGIVPFPPGQSALQVVFARGASAAPQASRLRYVLFDNPTATTQPAEYVGYQYPTTYGHNSCRDAFGVAAYSAFRPRIPESFTSPGPMWNVFDPAGNRLPSPEIRQKPDLAALDGANNTFFGGDSASDADAFPNFFGTSCAAANAAACAALVLQAKGGPGSLTVGQMKTILQSTALPHDLDPQHAQAEILTPGGRLTLRIDADSSNSSGGQIVTGGPFDPNVIAVAYAGPGAVKTIRFDLANGNPTGGTEAVGRVPGLVWDPRAVGSGGLPFALGRLVGLASGDIVAGFSVQPPAPSVAGQASHLTLTFADDTFTGGKGFTFNCDRDEFRPASLNPAQASAGGNSGDLWGENVEIPGGRVQLGGVVVTGTMQDGTPFTGRFRNAIGRGYSPLDGYGFIDAAAATAAPVPPVDR